MRLLFSICLLLFSTLASAATSPDEVRQFFAQAFDGAATVKSGMYRYKSRDKSWGQNESFVQDIRYFRVAQKRGRIFINPTDINALPKGVYTFAILDSGDIIFGLAESNIELGIKHFQLMQRQEAFVGGEFKNSGPEIEFNIYSGVITLPLLNQIPSSRDREREEKAMVRILKRGFKSLWGIQPKFIRETFIDKSQPRPIAILKTYCNEYLFYHMHKLTLCRDFDAPEEQTSFFNKRVADVGAMKNRILTARAKGFTPVIAIEPEGVVTGKGSVDSFKKTIRYWNSFGAEIIFVTMHEKASAPTIQAFLNKKGLGKFPIYYDDPVTYESVEHGKVEFTNQFVKSIKNGQLISVIDSKESSLIFFSFEGTPNLNLFENGKMMDVSDSCPDFLKIPEGF